MLQFKTVLLVALLLVGLNTYGQIILNAEVRPRAEFRNGYRSLAPDPINPGFAVSQRTRFNLSYNLDKISMVVSIQDIRTWGDVSQLNSADFNGLAIYQAWGQYQISKQVAVRFGRQSISYDDQRFLGKVGWAQQARSHDLVMLKYQKEKFKLDFGLAFNQDAVSDTGTVYSTPRNYKTMQYVWMHRDWDKLGVSFIALNNGLQYIGSNPDSSETRYSQTLGTHISRGFGNVKIAANAYYQMGNDVANREISAYLVGIDATWKPKSSKMFAGLGFEVQSGNDLDWDPATATTNNAFSPMYGTNHKFNGWMDYFYVGNHRNTVGLIDLYASVGRKFGKSKLKLVGHNFTSSAQMIDTNTPGVSLKRPRTLGAELDLVYILTMSKVANFKMGYSQMFASESMALIKPTGPSTNVNNWAWVMITLKPELFRHEIKKLAPTK